MRICRLFLLLALGLGGCLGSASPIPRAHYYRIVVPPPAERADTARFPGILSVARLDAEGLLRERPLLFSAGARAPEVRQYDYHYWSEPPALLLQDAMAMYLRSRNFAGAVVTPSLQVRADLEVTGKIKRLERVLGDGPPRVVAELHLALIALADDRLLLADTYTAELPADGDGVDAAVLALNRALLQIFDRFAADAGRVSRLARVSPRDVDPPGAR